MIAPPDDLTRRVCPQCWGSVRSAAFCDKCVERIAKLYKAICKVTTRYAFAAPVTGEDLEVFARELEDALPKGWRQRVTYAGGPSVTVEVFATSEPRRAYHREMIIEIQK